jgi:hypothetical protein
LKLSKLIGVIILVGFSIGFFVLLIENFSSFGKSQVTEIPTTQTPFLEAVNTKTNISTAMIKQ